MSIDDSRPRIRPEGKTRKGTGGNLAVVFKNMKRQYAPFFYGQYGLRSLTHETPEMEAPDYAQ